MNPDICVLGFGPLSEYGCVSELEGFDGNLRSSEPFQGLAKEPPRAIMNPDFPQKLPDYVKGSIGTLVVSPRLRAFLAEHVADIEFVPIRITGEGDKLISDEYQIAHLINHVDCIDMAVAKPKWYLRKEYIVRMEDRKLPLLLDQIPQHRRLFYPKFLTKLPLVRSDFGEMIVAAGFTNVRLKTIEECLPSL